MQFINNYFQNNKEIIAKIKKLIAIVLAKLVVGVVELEVVLGVVVEEEVVSDVGLL